MDAPLVSWIMDHLSVRPEWSCASHRVIHNTGGTTLQGLDVLLAVMRVSTGQPWATLMGSLHIFDSQGPVLYSDIFIYSIQTLIPSVLRCLTMTTPAGD